MNRLGSEALEVAKAKIGIKEATGKNDGPFILMVQRWVAAGSKWLDGQPWCACFATWCIYQAAEKLGMKPRMPKSASSTSLYAWFKKNGELLTAPEPFCVGLVKGSGGAKGKTHHHTFLVESIEGNVVKGIDGNYRNAVGRSVRLAKDCDFGRIV